MELLPEVEVWYGLPAIRAALTKALKKQGLSQKEIANKLGIAESAVSQYLSGKRGKSSLTKPFLTEVDVSAQRIATGTPGVVATETMRLVGLLRNSRAICDIHKQHTKGLPTNCDQCFV